MNALRRSIADRLLPPLAAPDAWITPTVPVPAPRVGTFAGRPPAEAFADAAALGAFTAAFNITGQPAASVPLGLTREGLPMGLQIARAAERARTWCSRCRGSSRRRRRGGTGGRRWRRGLRPDLAGASAPRRYVHRMRGRVPVLACLLLSCSPARDAAPAASASPSSQAAAPSQALPAASVAPALPPWQPLADLARPPDAPKTRADEALLTNLLGANRVRSCHGTPGEVLPSLGPGYAGAYTRPGVREMAYLVTFVPCVGRVTPGVVRPRPPAILVIAREHRPVLKAEVPGGRFIVPRDLNGDGVDENPGRGRRRRREDGARRRPPGRGDRDAGRPGPRRGALRGGRVPGHVEGSSGAGARDGVRGSTVSSPERGFGGLPHRGQKSFVAVPPGVGAPFSRTS